MQEYNVLKSTWFGKIGIVRIKDHWTGEEKNYIGSGFGLDQKMDEQNIAAWGMRIYETQWEDIFE